MFGARAEGADAATDSLISTVLCQNSGYFDTTLEAKSNINLNASAPVIGPGTNDHHTKC